MPRIPVTTALLRPVQAPTTDLWDDLLRPARRVGQGATRTLGRRSAHWLIPSVVTGVLAGIGLGRPGLWTDELATWGMATTPWAQFWPVLRYVDAVLAPYYAFMHLWVSVVGGSDVALRLPSLLAMAASAGLIGVLGARLADRATGFFAGLVFAFLPSTARYAAEARPYALTVLIACLATWLLLRAWERPTAVRWFAYGASLVALGAISVVSLLLVAAHAWVILAWIRPLWRRFLLTAVAAGAAMAPLLLYGSAQRHQIAYIPRISVASVAQYSEVLFGTIPIAVAVAVLALFSLPLRLPSAVFAAWAVAPAVALAAVSLAVPLFLPRYLLLTTPGWALLAGSALARVRPSWSYGAVVLLAVLALPAQLQIREPGGHDQATRQAAAVVAADAQPGDGIVYADDEPVGAWTTRDAMNHYLSGARPRDVLAIQPPRTGGLLPARECPNVAKCLSGTPRVWIVRTGHLSDPLAGIGVRKEVALATEYRITLLWYPEGLTVALLVRQEGH